MNGLGSSSDLERLANASLIRRFFDPSSEFGEGNTPYASDAARVISAILRTEPSGNLQKILADGLGRYPKLQHFDLQRTNLSNCYWGSTSRATAINASHADFYQADLTQASFKHATLKGTVFFEARLVNCIFRGADCRNANFNGADLKDCDFTGALLTGASFTQATNIPAVILPCLDTEGTYSEHLPVPCSPAPETDTRVNTIFVSAPSHIHEIDRIALEQILTIIKKSGFTPIQHLPNEYRPTSPLQEIRRRMDACGGVVVFAPPQISITECHWYASETSRPNSTILPASPWNQIEAGIAAGLNKPLFIIKRKAEGGIFDVQESPPNLEVVDLDKPGELSALALRISQWCNKIS